jgi:hypothetical protein
VGNAPICVLAVSGPELVNATFAIFALTRGSVRVTRSGPGSVQSSPEGIKCGTGRSCSATFDRGRDVTLKATPSDSRHSVSWPGETCSGQTCTVRALDTGKDVTVIFTLAMDELEVVKSGDGEGTVTSTPSGIQCGTICTKRFGRGTQVRLKAEAKSGSRFAGWSGGCTGTGACSVVAGQVTTVTARFDRVRDDVRVTKAGDGDGTVRSTPDGIACGATCAATFPRNSRVELRATPDGVSEFAGWKGACTGTSVCTISRLQGPKAVAARFDRLRDKLRVVKTGRGRGIITSSPAAISCGNDCSARFPRGTSVVLQAKPASGSRFAGWSGPCKGTGDCRLVMQGTVNVEARFARICAARSATVTSTKVATGPRRVLVTIGLDGNASVRLRLFHAGRRVKEKTVTGTKGLRTVRLDIPRTASAGKYRLKLHVADICGGTRTFERTISVPRRA